MGDFYIYSHKSSHYCLQLAFSFHIFLKEEMFSIINHVRELPYPVTENHHTHIARQHKIQFDMAMAKDIIIDVGMGRHIVTCIFYKILLVFTHIRRFLSIGTLQPTFLCPLQSEPHSPTRMNHTEQTLTYGIMKNLTYKLKVQIRIAQSITMSKIEKLTVDINRLRLLMQHYATLLLQITIHPQIVVTREIMHLNPHIGQFRQFAKEARIALRYDIFIFIPEIKHVAKQINGSRLMLYIVKKTYKASFMHPSMIYGERTEVRIRKYIDVLYNLNVEFRMLSCSRSAENRLPRFSLYPFPVLLLR